MDSKTKTRLLIISDTHSMDFSPEDRPLQRADVAIHCGDLTDGSKLEEFRTAIQLLKDINVPLKLAIAGNHDFTMDIPAFEKKIAEATPPLDPELVAKEYGAPGEARQLFEDAKDAGILFLDEGTHHFTLESGALLTIYASPYTPALGTWGFRYHPELGHEFSIERGVDVVVTHGPPKGIMDYTYGRERAGCPNLSPLSPEPDHESTALGISTKVGAQDWLPGEIVVASNQPISQLSTTTDPIW